MCKLFLLQFTWKPIDILFTTSKYIPIIYLEFILYKIYLRLIYFFFTVNGQVNSTGTKWANAELEAADEASDVQIYKSVVQSMEEWKQQKSSSKRWELVIYKCKKKIWTNKYAVETRSKIYLLEFLNRESNTRKMRKSYENDMW